MFHYKCFEVNKFIALFTMGTGQFERNEVRIKRIQFDDVLLYFIMLSDLIFGFIIRLVIHWHCYVLRQVALKALNERLAKAESHGWPLMEDGGESNTANSLTATLTENASNVSTSIAEQLSSSFDQPAQGST